MAGRQHKAKWESTHSTIVCLAVEASKNTCTEEMEGILSLVSVVKR